MKNEDAQLVNRFLAGDESAFTTLFLKQLTAKPNIEDVEPVNRRYGSTALFPTQTLGEKS